ncbi:DNA-processing protein DprA [Dubosiella newyorkensis]|uniref:DNA-processing protein DprA n=1 Tax=Dubosiella newyorkensis TaxID=1862672 RepID=UPI002730AE0A|nr:DNA-processing protein DprA [Dubosiella newyorkensis]
MNTYNYREAILYFSVQFSGNWNSIAHALHEKHPYASLEYPVDFVTIVDDDYPSCFKTLRFPPWILFYQGDLGLLDRKCIAVIGSRKCSPRGISNTQKVISVLKEKYVIVSGLARGIDQEAHRCSLKTGTIGIIGCGLNQIYPRSSAGLYDAIRKNHLLLSEYPLNTPPLAHHFPWRNRLIAAAADSLIVIEARHKSGTMITVNEMLNLSKQVYSLAGAFGEEEYAGCNELIDNGAKMILTLEDVKEI